MVKFIAGEDCGCEERKEKLNKLFPYKQTSCMTETRYKQWSEFRNKPTDVLQPDDQKFVAHTHAEIFNHSLHRPCTCNPKAWQKMIEEINGVYSTYESEEG